MRNAGFRTAVELNRKASLTEREKQEREYLMDRYFRFN